MKHWWGRECGGREVLAIAWPMMISTGFVSLLLFIDRMFLFWYSPEAMAAAMPAGALHWTTVSLPLGIAGYVNTFVAQYDGAGQPRRIGQSLGQGLRFSLYFYPLLLLLGLAAPTGFSWAGHEEHIHWQEVVYFQILSIGAGGVVASAALSSFYSGRGQTLVVMYVNVLATLVNLVLDYWFIFGGWGLQPGGIVGAGWATVVAEWAKVLAYVLLIYRPKYASTYQLLRGLRPDPALLRRILLFGTPNGMQMLIEGAAFTLIIMGMGEMGPTALAASTLAFNVNMVAFVPMYGVGIAVSTLVGRELTGGRTELAARATWTAVTLGGVYSGAFGLAYLLVPRLFLIGHAWGADPLSFHEVESLTVILLRFVAAYCVLDAVQIIFVGAIKGAGDTWFVLWGTLLTALASVTVGWIGVSLGAGLLWWWWIVTGYVSTLAILFVWRFLGGKWRQMSVIESPGIADAGRTPAERLKQVASE